LVGITLKCKGLEWVPKLMTATVFGLEIEVCGKTVAIFDTIEQVPGDVDPMVRGIIPGTNLVKRFINGVAIRSVLPATSIADDDLSIP
jgi:hypothetical protein